MLYNINIEIQEVLIMKYAIVNGNRTHISKVERGTVGKEFGYRNLLVKACKGKHKQYWKHISKTSYIYH
jgi:hypothetical protein